MKINKIITTLLSTILLMSLFATSAFAASKPYCEAESNNTQATADYYEFEYPSYSSVIMYGTCNSNDIKDYSQVNLVSKNYTSIKADTSFRGAPDCTYQFTVYDNDMREWGRGTSTSGSSVDIFNLLIQKGKPWYFEVKLLDGTPTQPYRFHINATDAY